MDRELDVLRTLMDQRVGLSGDEAFEVADMNYQQRVTLLGKLVELAHEAAIDEDGIREIERRHK